MTTGGGTVVSAGILLAVITGGEMYRCHCKGATMMGRRWSRRRITTQWVPRERNPTLYRRNMRLLGFFCLLGIALAIGGMIFPSVIH